MKRERISGGLWGIFGPAFNGSPVAMVLNLLETADLDSDEMDELRKLINRKAKESQT